MSQPSDPRHRDLPGQPEAAEGRTADAPRVTLTDPSAAAWPDAARLRDARDLIFARHIGPYRLIALLGEGGMGQVYLAAQELPIRRDVALKVIKRGMDTDAIVRRFASERLALALMDHPAIARVLDAGTTEDGRPFVVMEVVDGPRLTDYCDDAQLAVPARLRLFLQVLRGVQHAHQKGVLHRDLKPSNVLVATVDGQPQPKIIDFGIAKALTDDAALATQVTVVGQFVGTPEYMSPEQAGVIAGGVDTRSDVYSLGVMLFELLTGHRPYEFDRRTPTAVSAQLTARRPAVAPSAAVQTRTLGRTADDTVLDRAAARASSPARLRRTLRGDLDTIVLKAMHPEPDRRYDSVEQLAADLERHLAGQPVQARRDTLWYRSDRFVRRHRLGVAAACLLVLASVIFVAALVRARNRAVEAERHARVEAATAREVAGFLVGLFDAVDPDDAGGQEVTAREMVDRGAERIRHELTDRPLVRSQLLFTLGDVYRALGRAERAEPLLREALVIRERTAGADDTAVAETLGKLARVRLDLGDRVESRALYERALAIREAVEGPRSAGVAEVLNNLGLVHLTDGRYAEAAAMLGRAVELRRSLPAEAHTKGGAALYNLAVAQYELGHHREAEASLAEAVPLLRAQHGTDAPHSSLVSVASFRGLLLRELKQFEEARDVLEAGVAEARLLYPEAHPLLGSILNNLALVVQRLGDLDRAEALYREVLANDRGVHGDEHANVAHSYYNLGTFLYTHRQQRQEGTRLVETALTMRQRLLGTEHPQTARTLKTLGDYRADAGRWREAAALYERAQAIQSRVLPAEHADLVATRAGLEAARTHQP